MVNRPIMDSEEWDEWSAQGGDSLADRMSMQVKKILDSRRFNRLRKRYRMRSIRL
jgi:trimethylamine:corrinoid methyltransferase-like protein